MAFRLVVLLVSLTMVNARTGIRRQSLVPTISMSSPDLSASNFMEALRQHGAVVFTDLGEEYTAAVESMKEKAPSCLDEALQVTMDDGSDRFTLARDTVSDNRPFPACVAQEATSISAAFDRVDQLFSDLMKDEYGPRLDVVTENSITPWDEYGSKTHLHVYKKTQQTSNDGLALPYHTDNGLYVLLTPSDNLPLRSISRDGSVNFLGSGDVILILGTGLTQWLLPGVGLYAAPHAVPALSTSLTPAPRTVMSRMRVAPSLSRPQTGSKTSFDSHFLAPLESETGPTLARLRKQRLAHPTNWVQDPSRSQCSQSWPHACQHQFLPTVTMASPVPSSSNLIDALRIHGAVVFTDLGEEYTAAVERMKEKAPSCLDGALQVTLDDGSDRFTLSRDTISDNYPFPACIAEEAADISAAFDRVDQVFSQVLKQEYGPRLDVVTENTLTPWDEFDSKTHLHVYKRTQQTTDAGQALPYHTDNGLHVLLTPSDNLPLRSISSDGNVNILGTGDIILILGTGLTQWLLPEESLYAAPHAVPPLSTSLTPAPRTVMSRMRVAPSLSLPQTGSQITFDSHFLAPLESESGPTLTRMLKQRSSHPNGHCSRSWTHACGCVMQGTQFTWKNGELGEKHNVASATDCQLGCKATPGCAGWTWNSNNKWCGFKSANQIKKAKNAGFTSGMMDVSSSYCRG